MTDNLRTFVNFPVLGEDTELFLKKFLKISAEGLKKLKLKKII